MAASERPLYFILILFILFFSINSCYPIFKSQALIYAVNVIIKKYILGPVQTACYLLCCTESRKAALIDPGDRSSEIASFLKEGNYELCYIINTHGHFDHTGGNRYFSGTSGTSGKPVPVVLHRLDMELMKSGGGASCFGLDIETSPEPSIDAAETASITFGSVTLEIIHTPGHTPGHISLYHSSSSSLFCGDVLFFRSVGRTDLPGGSQKMLLQSIREKLFALPGDTAVYPGHGPGTIIDDEKKYNPWAAV
jgi:hydroxyacylglutathione hydrolase